MAALFIFISAFIFTFSQAFAEVTMTCELEGEKIEVVTFAQPTIQRISQHLQTDNQLKTFFTQLDSRRFCSMSGVSYEECKKILTSRDFLYNVLDMQSEIKQLDCNIGLNFLLLK